MNKKVMVGMSGGVDSSAACIVLMEQGYEVIGATMKLLPDNLSEFDDASIKDAKAVCDTLGICHYVFDFRDEFKKYVIDNFVNEYIHARTPNPCIQCNKFLKFGLMLDKADELGIDYIATGHYAKTEYENGEYRLKSGDEKSKDQSYVLYNITQKQLSRLIFPICEYSKDEARELCRKYKLPVAEKSESMDICFVRDGNYQKFISDYTGIKSSKGDICDRDGNVIGEHNGLISYTVGQRKGLGAYGKPMFVLSLDIENNRLVLGEKGTEFSKSLYADNINFISGKIPEKPFFAAAKIRYKAEPAKCEIIMHDGFCEVIFDNPQRAVTPGQSVVFYDGDYVLGGGIVR